MTVRDYHQTRDGFAVLIGSQWRDIGPACFLGDRLITLAGVTYRIAA